MTSRRTNPFEVLGIHPQGLKKLSRSQVKDVVTSMYRALAKHHHPDAGARADVERFKLVQDAYETLTNDPEAFKFWLTSLRSGGKKEREALQEELEKLQETMQLLSARLVGFWELSKGLQVSGVFHHGKLSAAFGLTERRLGTPFLLRPHEDGHRMADLEKVEIQPGEELPADAIWPQAQSRKPYYWRERPNKHGGYFFLKSPIIGGISESGVREILASLKQNDVSSSAIAYDEDDVPSCAWYTKHRRDTVPLERFVPYIRFVEPEVRVSHEVLMLNSDASIDFAGKLIREWSC